MPYEALDPFVDGLLVDGRELLISDRDGTYTYIKQPTTAATFFLREVDLLKRRAVRITRENFDKFYPPKSQQLSFSFYQQ